MNRYDEMMSRHQKEANAFPMHFAFGNAQLKREVESMGLSMNENSEQYFAKHVVSIGYGGFILKSDADKLKEILCRHKEELVAAIKEDETGEGFIYDMFYSELCNHEYGYTHDSSEALETLNIKKKDLENDERLARGFELACKKAIGAYEAGN